VTRGQLPQRAGSLGLNGGGTAAAVPPLGDAGVIDTRPKNELVVGQNTPKSLALNSPYV